MGHYVLQGIQNSAWLERTDDLHDSAGASEHTANTTTSSTNHTPTVWLNMFQNIFKPNDEPFDLILRTIQQLIQERRKVWQVPSNQPVPGWDLYFVDTTDNGVYFW